MANTQDDDQDTDMATDFGIDQDSHPTIVQSLAHTQNTGNFQHTVHSDEPDDETDSAMGSDGFPSETASLAQEITNYRWVHGRRWASDSWPRRLHYFPNDDMEVARYQLSEAMVYHALDDRLYTAPLDPRNVHHVLDTGCGAGSWCIAMADCHERIQVRGVDLFPLQPTNVPMNCRFEVDDLEEYPWSFGFTFDYIRVSGLSGSITDWPRFHAECLHNLTPGGWVELVDHDFRIRADDDSMDVERSPSTNSWMDHMCSAASLVGKRLDAVEHHAWALRNAGFVNITEKVVDMPIGARTDDNQARRHIATLNEQQIADAIPAWSWAFLRGVLSLNPEYIHVLIASVVRELVRQPNKRLFIRWRFISAQKPSTTSRGS